MESGPAYTPHDSSPLVSASALHEALAATDLLLIDCRYQLGQSSWGRVQYGQAHLPGAVFACMDTELAGPRQPDTGRHPLPTAAAFASTLGRWGLTAATRVVAYDQGNGACAARLWWMLRAVGHSRVKVLDGGIAQWQREGFAVTTDIAARRPTSVAPCEYRNVLSAAEVQSALATGAISLIDARGADRFAGQNETIDPVAGHVPGALNHPFTLNLDSELRFLAPTQLKQRWAHVLERPNAARLATMCGSGITACHNLLALELLGVHDVPLYAGSFSEWITNPQRPVATGVSA
jgi:thiosulfate/3-mercaptopyruvate sulfurtransferase